MFKKYFESVLKDFVRSKFQSSVHNVEYKETYIFNHVDIHRFMILTDGTIGISEFREKLSEFFKCERNLSKVKIICDGFPEKGWIMFIPKRNYHNFNPIVDRFSIEVVDGDWDILGVSKDAEMMSSINELMER